MKENIDDNYFRHLTLRCKSQKVVETRKNEMTKLNKHEKDEWNAITKEKFQRMTNKPTTDTHLIVVTLRVLATGKCM